MCLPLIGPLFLKLRNSHTAVVENFLHGGTLFAYTLLETAPKPISKLPAHFVTSDCHMVINEPDAALTLSNNELMSDRV